MTTKYPNATPAARRTAEKSEKPATTRCTCFWKAGAKKPHICQRITGRAMMNAAQRLIQKEVMNGSVTLSVTGLYPLGSGLFSHLSSVPWNQYVKPKATARAIRQKTMRVRSSPRCSTTLASSPCSRRRGSSRMALDRVELALARADRGGPDGLLDGLGGRDLGGGRGGLFVV